MRFIFWPIKKKDSGKRRRGDTGKKSLAKKSPCLSVSASPYLAFLSRWQGLWAGLAALAIFTGAPYALEFFFPEDGALRPGSYLHCLLLGIAIFFFGIFLAWVVVQIDFKSFNARINAGWIAAWLDDLDRDPKISTAKKICVLLAPFFFVLLWLAFALSLAVSLVK